MTTQLRALLSRPEAIAFVTAVTLTVLSYLAVRSGLPVPAEEVNFVVAGFWAVFLGAVFEGGFKPNYTGAGRVFTGGKAKTLYIGLGALVAQAVGKSAGIEIPDEIAANLSNFFLIAIVGKGVFDGAGVAVGKAVRTGI